MIEGRDFPAFEENEVLQSAVQYQLMVMGESCSKLQDATLAEMPEVPLSQVRGFRNRIVHGYFAIDLGIVWEITQDPAPALAASEERALAALFLETYRRLQERRNQDEA